MNAHGTTVLLDVDIDRLHERLLRGRHSALLIASKSDDELRRFIVEALAARMPHYEKPLGGSRPTVSTTNRIRPSQRAASLNSFNSRP